MYCFCFFFGWERSGGSKIKRAIRKNAKRSKERHKKLLKRLQEIIAKKEWEKGRGEGIDCMCTVSYYDLVSCRELLYHSIKDVVKVESNVNCKNQHRHRHRHRQRYRQREERRKANVVSLSTGLSSLSCFLTMKNRAKFVIKMNEWVAAVDFDVSSRTFCVYSDILLLLLLDSYLELSFSLNLFVILFHLFYSTFCIIPLMEYVARSWTLKR